MNLKKKIFGLVSLILLVGVMVFNVSLSTNSSGQQMSKVTLKTIEALAGSGDEATCSYDCCDSCSIECSGSTCSSGSESVMCDGEQINCDDSDQCEDECDPILV